jgi:transposase-like protein
MNRQKWDSKTKAMIVLSGLKGRPVSEICEEYQIGQNQYYKWRDQFLTNLPGVFEAGGRREKALRREGKDLNRRKNDYRDSEVAAQLLCTGEFTDSKLLQGVYAELRATHNTYNRLVREQTRISNLLKGLLDGIFPEFTQVFKDPCRVTSLTVLSTCAIPGIIAVMTEEEFIARLKAIGRSRLRRDELRAIHRQARASVGIAAGAQAVALEISL